MQKITMKRNKFIIISGNIGVGKTTLIDKLNSTLGWKGYPPEVPNPYHNKFENNKYKWGFHRQISFLSKKIKLYRHIESEQINFIMERSIWEEYEVFMKSLLMDGYVTEDEFNMYTVLYENIINTLIKPDMIIYTPQNKIPIKQV